MKNCLHLRGRVALALALSATLVLSLAGPAAAGSGRAFNGHLTGPSSIEMFSPACPNAPFYVAGNGQGNFTHLGRVTYTLHHCANGDGDGNIWTVGKGSMTLTGVRGDQVQMEYDMWGHADSATAPSMGFGGFSWTITGGTGRFAHATGSGTATLFVAYYYDPSPGATLFATWRGRILY